MAPMSNDEGVGVIVPPPDIKTIIDKMARFVAKHGDEFEAKVIATEKNNPKFSFVQANNHYHAYYQQQVRSLKEPPPSARPAAKEEVVEEETAKEEADSNVAEGSAASKAEERKTFLDKLRSGGTIVAKEASAEAQKAQQKKPDKPPEKKFLLNLPQYAMLNALDLDIIKLTAQFVARNGDAFRAGIAQREMRNPQFDFMKLGHPAYHFFQTLVQSYTACLLPPRDATEKLEKETNGEVLERVLKDVEWRRYQESTSEAAIEREKKEREARAVIDWHKFVIVETIDFNEEEEMPAPKKLQAEEAESEEKPDEVEQELDEEEGPMNIRKDYKPNLPGGGPRRQLAKCPVCAQEMPVDELDEHMRMEMMDRNNMQQSRKQETTKSALAPALDIHRHLAALKDHRTDIFGDEEELAIGKSANSQGSKPSGPVWDGHSSSAQMATAQALRVEPPAQQATASGISLPMKRTNPEQPAASSQPTEFQLHQQRLQQQHQQRQLGTPTQFSATGNLPPPQFGGPPSTGHVQPPFQQQQMQQQPHTINVIPGAMKGQPLPGQGPPPDANQPPPKKTKLGDWTEQLVPEADFAAQHSSGITCSIVVPVHSNKAGWKMNGQTVAVSLAVTSSVGVLKEKLQEATGVPPNKQKLKVDGLPVLRDNFTLAYYNIGPTTAVQFGVKERGRGRK